jgi:hypothetical protein
VYLTVITNATAIHRIDVGAPPELKQLGIGVDMFHELLELRVVLSWDMKNGPRGIHGSSFGGTKG